jgi:glucosyl-3-phosphoglycerate synthase
MRAELARTTRIPGDWGLEVGMLAEIYRNRSISRVCQTDLTQNYEHKHQSLSEEDPAQGLMRMSGDICKTLFRTLASEGAVFTEGIFRSLEVRYVRLAEDTIKCYYADARLNGLEFDRHQEEQAVAAFSRMVRAAAQSFLEDPLGKPLIPNWNRVVAAIPNFFQLLLEAVEADNQSEDEPRLAQAA